MSQTANPTHSCVPTGALAVVASAPHVHLISFLPNQTMPQYLIHSHYLLIPHPHPPIMVGTVGLWVEVHQQTKLFLMFLLCSVRSLVLGTYGWGTHTHFFTVTLTLNWVNNNSITLHVVKHFQVLFFFKGGKKEQLQLVTQQFLYTGMTWDIHTQKRQVKISKQGQGHEMS